MILPNTNFLMLVSIEQTIQVLGIIFGASGFWHTIVYLFIFFSWKRKNKHKMQFCFEITAKWFAIFLFNIPIVALSNWLGLTKPHLHRAIVPLFMIISCLYMLLTSYIFYKFKLIKRYELFIPFCIWSPAVILMIYKKRQMQLMSEKTATQMNDL